MRIFFNMDKKDYDPNGRAFIRPSVRSIVLRDGKVAMVHSIKYDYYKFPGGGMEPGESRIDTLIRETREEAGLVVIPDTIREFGMVHRVQKSTHGKDFDLFIQDNYYYLCQAEPEIRQQELDDYEAEEHFTLEYVRPEDAIATNRFIPHGPKDQVMLEREARVLEILMAEVLEEGNERCGSDCNY